MVLRYIRILYYSSSEYLTEKFRGLVTTSLELVGVNLGRFLHAFKELAYLCAILRRSICFVRFHLSSKPLFG